MPDRYVSDGRLSGSATYDNATVASLGVTSGTYEWTWGSGANQNFTLQVPAPAIGRGLPAFLAIGGAWIVHLVFLRFRRESVKAA